MNPTPSLPLPFHLRRIALHGFLLIFCCATALSQSRLLDDFESLNGWKPLVSEGAKLELSQGEGKTGLAMVMNFDFNGVNGYAIAQKEFPLDLPLNYQFTFDMRADAPVNNFEFKLLDEKDNIFWIKELNIEYPKEWTRERIKKRRLTFAWGPARADEIRKVRKIEFVVSVGTGGKGTVSIDNFSLEPINDADSKFVQPVLTSSSIRGGRAPQIDTAGTVLTNWHSATGERNEWIQVDFHRPREIGGLVIDWDSTDYARSYDVLLSDNGTEWTTSYAVAHGNGGRDYVYMHEGEGRFLKVAMNDGSGGRGYGIRRMEFKPAQFSVTPNDFFRSVASGSAPGLYPKYLLDRQSFWTVMGVNGDVKEALMNEQGQIEVDRQQFSLEPFLYIDNKLVTWSDVKLTPTLLNDYLPIPSVTWKYRNVWQLTVQAVAAGLPGKSLLGVKYSIDSKVSSPGAKLYIAVRPFQVNPPWQGLNIMGGVARVDSISYRNGMVEVNGVRGVTVIPMSKPTAFGAVEFDQGDITEYLRHGDVPSGQEVRDHFGYASAVLAYDLDIKAGETKDIFLAVPLHGWRGSPTPDMHTGGAELYYSLMLKQTVFEWESKLNTVQWRVPPRAQDVINTVKSNLGYIFINRDGPGFQPGSRSYERSWIRDGSLTCSALLRMGITKEVREFIDWYAKGQFPSGKIPCVIDSRGPDAVPEHDSNGEFIYAVLQYYLFTGDTVWLRGKFDAVVKTVRYIQSLRAERKTDAYKNGTSGQRACYGLVPESISHEGYSDVPRHSYWDDFFILRGLKDATTIAGILGEKKIASECRDEREDLRKDLYASMRLAMKNHLVDYIPGCAELGDFDATSTTIGVSPGGELGNIPEPQMHNTFDRYYKFFVDRKTRNDYVNYTPYETRVIGTFVFLGQKKRAEEALNFFMHDRRPAAWNEWAEVVWRDPETPKFIGDMPHTWVGSDFIRSVLSMFLYERERDGATVLAAGIPDAWVNDPAGIQLQGFATPFGLVNYSLQKKGRSVVAEVSGGFDPAKRPLVMQSPLSGKARSVSIDGAKVLPTSHGDVIIRKLPARVEFKY